MEECEKCEKRKRDVFRRAEHGRVVCNKCHQEIMRKDSPTGIFRFPRHLYQSKEPPSSED